MDPQEKTFYKSLLIALVIIGAILGFFIISIIRQQRRYRKLAQAKISAEIKTLENERQRIASDLHDEVGPLLSAIKLQINHLEAEKEQDLQLIEKSSQYIDDVIKKMRDISNDLLPNILIRKGLGAALADFVTKLSSSSNLVIDLEAELPDRLPQPIEVNIYRIVQEITHNTVKHAGAQKLTIRINVDKNENLIRVATADDGKGFNPEKMNNDKYGLGLLNLQSRTDMMGGEFNCLSQPGKGTKYLFEIPTTPINQHV